jgi:hypothetical protein
MTMGHGAFNPTEYLATASVTKTKTIRENFTSSHLHADLDPKGFTNGIRESVDSPDNPKSTPIIVALDVTGSMGSLANQMAMEGLGILFQEILDRKPVSDPHLMFIAIGDVRCDQAPIQVSQFEADNRIVEQLQKIFVEGGGGGNLTESYDAAWAVAGLMTKTDSFTKRAKKGYLFTVGDEQTPTGINKNQLKRFFGLNSEVDYTAEQLLTIAQTQYEVFHIAVQQGDHYRHSGRQVDETWGALLGQRYLKLSDSTALAELVVSAIQVIEGAEADKVASSWSGHKGLVVAAGIKDLVPAKKNAGMQRSA